MFYRDFSIKRYYIVALSLLVIVLIGLGIYTLSLQKSSADQIINSSRLPDVEYEESGSVVDFLSGIEEQTGE